MNEYFSLAGLYDRIMEETDYDAWAEYLVKHFERMGAEVSSVLDLACGTGVITCRLAAKGYELIGVDISPEMLMEANARAAEGEYAVAPMFINQDLRDLDMYGTSDAAICSFDGLNYLETEELGDVFKRISYFVRPGGVFIFDVNTEEKFRKMDGMTYIDEDEDFFCAWRTDYYEEERECVYCVDVFRREGRLWSRSSEEHVEYTHDAEALKELLLKNGFEEVEFFGELSFDAPGSDAERVFVCCRRKV